MVLTRIVLVSLILLSGCHASLPEPPFPYRLVPLAEDELGPAAKCIWIGTQPDVCVADPKRATVNREHYQSLLDQIKRYTDDEKNRRQL